MNGLLSCSPSPMVARLCVAATVLLLTHLAFLIAVPVLAGAAKAISWIVGVVAAAAFGLALFGRWPSRTGVWGRRDDA